MQKIKCKTKEIILLTVQQQQRQQQQQHHGHIHNLVSFVCIFATNKDVEEFLQPTTTTTTTTTTTKTTFLIYFCAKVKMQKKTAAGLSNWSTVKSSFQVFPPAKLDKH